MESQMHIAKYRRIAFNNYMLTYFIFAVLHLDKPFGQILEGIRFEAMPSYHFLFFRCESVSLIASASCIILFTHSG